MASTPNLEIGGFLVLDQTPHPHRAERTVGKIAVTLTETIDARQVTHGVTVTVVAQTHARMTNQDVQGALVARARDVMQRAIAAA